MTQTLAAKYTDCTLPPKSTLQVQSWHLPLQTKHIHRSLLMIHLSRRTWGKISRNCLTESWKHHEQPKHNNDDYIGHELKIINDHASLLTLPRENLEQEQLAVQSVLQSRLAPITNTIFRRQCKFCVMCVHSRWIFFNQTQFFWSSIPILPSTTARQTGKAARQKRNIFFIWGLLVMCWWCIAQRARYLWYHKLFSQQISPVSRAQIAVWNWAPFLRVLVGRLSSWMF